MMSCLFAYHSFQSHCVLAFKVLWWKRKTLSDIVIGIVLCLVSIKLHCIAWSIIVLTIIFKAWLWSKWVYKPSAISSQATRLPLNRYGKIGCNNKIVVPSLGKSQRGKEGRYSASQVLTLCIRFLVKKATCWPSMMIPLSWVPWCWY